MAQRGITPDEIQRVLIEGREAADAKPDTYGKVLVFRYNEEWEGQFYEEKEVTVYYKAVGSRLILLTATARYGSSFPGGGPE